MGPRIGLLIVGHPDYPNAVGERFAREAVARLGEVGVEIVGAPSSHTDPLTAAAAARQLLKQDVEGILLFLGTWLECSTALAAVREFEHLPFAIWGIPMFDDSEGRESTGSFVAACMLKGTLERMGYRHPTLIGLPENPVTVRQALSFARAAHATERLKRTRLGLVGYSAMAIYPGTFDQALLRRIIGPEVVQFDTYTVIRSAEQVGPEAAAELATNLLTSCRSDVAPARLTKACGLAVALQQLVSEHCLDSLNVKCQYELSQEYGMTACVPLSWLADTGVISGCEGDVMVTATQCLLHYLTGQVIAYGDILDLQGDRMLLSSCGFAPFSLAHPEPEPCLRELDYPGFDGIISSCTLKRGPVTLARLVEGRGDYRLLYGTGVGVATTLRQGRFPALTIALDGSPERLMELIASQHFALCYGDFGAELQDVCRILDIEPQRF
jgi:L-fucose isomerase-like protein